MAVFVLYVTVWISHNSFASLTIAIRTLFKISRKLFSDSCILFNVKTVPFLVLYCVWLSCSPDADGRLEMTMTGHQYARQIWEKYAKIGWKSLSLKIKRIRKQQTKASKIHNSNSDRSITRVQLSLFGAYGSETLNIYFVHLVDYVTFAHRQFTNDGYSNNNK